MKSLRIAVNILTLIFLLGFLSLFSAILWKGSVTIALNKFLLVGILTLLSVTFAHLLALYLYEKMQANKYLSLNSITSKFGVVFCGVWIGTIIILLRDRDNQATFTEANEFILYMEILTVIFMIAVTLLHLRGLLKKGPVPTAHGPLFII